MVAPTSAVAWVSLEELRLLSERLTAYGDITFSASEARRVVSGLKQLHDSLERQAAITRELLVYMDRALLAEGLLRRVVPYLKEQEATADLQDEIAHAVRH